MFTASIATVIIVLVMAFIFLRYYRRAFALAILPLLTVPALYVISTFVAGYFFKDALLIAQIISCTLLLAVVVAGILFGLCTLMFTSKKAKTSYLILCGGFTLVFALVLLLNTIPKI